MQVEDEVRGALAWLERRGTARVRDEMATRYGIVTDKASGVSVGLMRQHPKLLGPNHELALALWDTGWYEARMLASFVDEPDRVTAGRMDRWCRDFDSWSICDTVCFHLFDRTPHAWRKVEQWSTRRGELQKRAAFALLASMALHEQEASDDRFLAPLPLIERAAADDGNFVQKGVWSPRGIGSRGPGLHAAAVEVARRLADAPEAGDRGAQSRGSFARCGAVRVA